MHPCSCLQRQACGAPFPSQGRDHLARGPEPRAVPRALTIPAGQQQKAGGRPPCPPLAAAGCGCRAWRRPACSRKDFHAGARRPAGLRQAARVEGVGGPGFLRTARAGEARNKRIRCRRLGETSLTSHSPASSAVSCRTSVGVRACGESFTRRTGREGSRARPQRLGGHGFAPRRPLRGSPRLSPGASQLLLRLGKHLVSGRPRAHSRLRVWGGGALRCECPLCKSWKLSQTPVFLRMDTDWDSAVAESPISHSR